MIINTDSCTSLRIIKMANLRVCTFSAANVYYIPLTDGPRRHTVHVVIGTLLSTKYLASRVR